MKSNIYESHSKIFKIKAIMGGEFHAEAVVASA
jgi:hypothetical protein